MAVGFDAIASAVTVSAGNNDTSMNITNMTVGSGSNRCLLVVVGFCGFTSAPTSITASWDSAGTPQSMYLITEQSQPTATQYHVAIFGLVAPTSGNKTLALSWTNGARVHASCVAFTDVDQTGTTTTFTAETATTGSSTSPAIAIDTASGDATVSELAFDDALTPTSPAFSSIYATNTGADFVGSGGQYHLATGASDNHTWSLSGSCHWVMVGTSVKASGGGPVTVGLSGNAATVGRGTQTPGIEVPL